MKLHSNPDPVLALAGYEAAYGRAKTDAEKNLILALIAHTKREIATLLINPS
jgi:hypothetical protein